MSKLERHHVTVGSMLRFESDITKNPNYFEIWEVVFISTKGVFAQPIEVSSKSKYNWNNHPGAEFDWGFILGGSWKLDSSWLLKQEFQKELDEIINE